MKLPPPPRRGPADATTHGSAPTAAAPDSMFDDTTIARPAGGRPTVALCVTGSIAAYKAALIARLLVQGGLRVVPVLTRSAREFVGPATFAGITGEKVVGEMFGDAMAGELHVDLGREADLVLVAPATTDVLARLAQGRADDLVTALCLCARGPVLAAPAMHPRMWAHPATQRNVATLAADGRVEVVGPVEGEVASGEHGMGRMAEPETIARAVLARIGRRDLTGLRVVVSAGPTVEDLDPVRFLGNRSTGKMGFAVAERAAARGATTLLVAGPTDLPTPWGVRRVDVRGALDMRAALWQALGAGLDGADALLMVAAVADYRPAERRTTKIKREGAPMTVELVPNPDLLAELGAARTGPRPILVGFAVETESDDRMVAAALNKLESKRVDFIVANHAAESFGRDDNRATFVSRAGAEALGVMPKSALADRILDRVMMLHGRIGARAAVPPPPAPAPPPAEAAAAGTVAERAR